MGLWSYLRRLGSWARANLLTLLAVCALALALALSISSGLLEGLKESARGWVLDYGLLGAFFATLLAGTAIPMGSPVIVAFCASLGVPFLPLVLVASTGYTFGLMVNYGLGYSLGWGFVRKKVPGEKLEKLSSWLDKWGLGLVLAFGLIPATPLETLSLICGAFRTNPLKFALVGWSAKLIQFSLFAFLGQELAWLVWG